eukprot:300781-Karenia_brevis.AAC.1
MDDYRCIGMGSSESESEDDIEMILTTQKNPELGEDKNEDDESSIDDNDEDDCYGGSPILQALPKCTRESHSEIVRKSGLIPKAILVL